MRCEIVNLYTVLDFSLLTYCNLETPEGYLAKSADSDQTPQNAASDQGLHCLQIGQSFFSRNI